MLAVARLIISTTLRAWIVVRFSNNLYVYLIFILVVVLARGSEYPDNSVTSHLFSGKRPDTAFQRYRNSRLGGDHHSEISGRSLSECLDECLRQPSFQCRSAVYSERYRTCRLSRYNQRDGMRIIYDADYDYYENLMRTYRNIHVIVACVFWNKSKMLQIT